jgi:hypothetical protein
MSPTAEATGPLLAGFAGSLSGSGRRRGPEPTFGSIASTGAELEHDEHLTHRNRCHRP